MKSLPKLLFLSAVLALAGCGKNNESGKSSRRGVCLQYNMNGQCSSYSSGNYVSGNNINISGYLSQIPCLNQMGMGMARMQQTIQVQTASVAARGQSYLGVTSLGDIAIVIGNGTTNAQMQVFLCPGQMMGPSMGPVVLGEFTSPACPIKVITAASLGGLVNFRDPGFPLLNGQPLPFCRR